MMCLEERPRGPRDHEARQAVRPVVSQPMLDAHWHHSIMHGLFINGLEEGEVHVTMKLGKPYDPW